MVFKFAPLGFTPGFNVKEEDDGDVPGFNVRLEDAVPWINVGQESALAAQRGGAETQDDPNVVPAAWGDLKCSTCGAGKHSGMTGAVRINGRVHCHNCAVKALGIENLSGAEQARVLAPYLLQPISTPAPQSRPQSPQPRTPLPRPPRIGR